MTTTNTELLAISTYSRAHAMHITPYTRATFKEEMEGGRRTFMASAGVRACSGVWSSVPSGVHRQNPWWGVRGFAPEADDFFRFETQFCAWIKHRGSLIACILWWFLEVFGSQWVWDWVHFKYSKNHLVCGWCFCLFNFSSLDLT
jgi:hypothetical protein